MDKQTKNRTVKKRKGEVVINMFEKYQKHIVWGFIMLFTIVMFYVMHPAWFQ